MAAVPDNTRWTLVSAAAGGDAAARATFFERYAPLARAWLGARWQGHRLAQEIEDAVQHVFLECYRERGALERVEAGRPGGFRAFLVGVIRNVALRHERALQQAPEQADTALGDLEGREQRCSVALDREWAQTVMREARALMEQRQAERGHQERRRCELLRLRFEEGMPIRDIAARWDVDAAGLHVEYRHARRDFHACLREVVAEGGEAADLDAEIQRLLELLSG